MAVPVKEFEPQQLAAGDTISFRKGFSDFPASAGWALKYELAGVVNYEFTSTAVGDGHQLTVAADVTALWLPGDYELTGYAVNAGTGEREQIYQAQIKIAPNIPGGAAPVQSHARQMVALIQDVMLGKARHDILESDIEGSRIKRLSPAELRKEYVFWKNELAGEVAADRARQGLPNQRKILPQFNITGGFGVRVASRPPWDR